MDRNKIIYADYNATTPVDPEVAEAMIPYLTTYFGNPSSDHEFGYKAKEAVGRARRQVADCLCCKPTEIVFTSGGTEANNMAVIGIATANRERGNHIITCTIEHPSILEPLKYLQSQGFEVTYVPVDRYGMVDPKDIQDALRDSTVLITIMHANNEVGTIQPITEIAGIAQEREIYFHSDAAQTIGKIPALVDCLGVDLLTIAGHKLYAPKGIGALYIKEGTAIDPLIRGASQELGMRAGTEPVAGIVALGKACEIAASSLERVSSRLHNLSERLYELLIMNTGEVKLNGHPTLRLPNTLNISFPGILGPDLLASCPEIAASPGSACHAGSKDISPVLKAMGIEETFALGAVRISVGKWTTDDEVDEIVDLLSARYSMLLEGHTHKRASAGC